MAIARRVYLYGIAFIALGMLVWGLRGLLESVLSTALAAAISGPVSVGEDPLRGRISSSGSLAAIGLVAWLIHWGLADRTARRDSVAGLTERRSAIRKLFLYGALALGSLELAASLAGLATNLLRGSFGLLTVADLITGRIADPIARIAVTGAFWSYYTRVARLDRAIEPEAGAGATLRRWHAYTPAFVGLMVGLFAMAGLIRLLWETLIAIPAAVSIGPAGIAAEVAGRAGALTAGLILWVGYWRWSTAWFQAAGGRDPDVRSILRKVYLYLVLAVAIAWTVWNLGGILNGLLRQILLADAATTSWAGMFRDLGGPLGYVLTFGIIWLYHARAVGHEAAVAGERRRQATIRWIYLYLVALVAVITVAVGLAGAASTLIDLIAQPGAVRPTRWWEDRISLFATLVVVGLPLWGWFWAGLQREAGDPFARGSLIRRIYLLLAIALSVLTLLGSSAFTLYSLIRLALGEPWSAGQTSELITAASAAAVAALFLAYHLRVIQRDAATPAVVAPPEPLPVGAPPDPAPAGAPHFAVAFIRAADRAALDAWRAGLTRGLPAGVEVDTREVDAETAARLRDLSP